MYFIETRQLGLEPESARKDKLQTRISNKLPVRALNKLLKTQAGDISPYFYENSFRLHVSNIRAKFLVTVKAHRKTIRQTVKKPVVHSHFKAKQTSKQINYFCPKRVQTIVILQ